MSIVWTNEQQRAIEAHGKNILVSAAAGSGKTAVLVERVIKAITDEQKPVMVDRLLIVTFTNAAAGGMQIKIHKALREMLDKNSDNPHIAKQLALLPRATITTVHSFCKDFLKNYFYKAGIPANFEIGDETQLSILRTMALDEVLEKRYENPSSGFEALVDGFGGKQSDNLLSEIVLKLYNFTQSIANPGHWLKCARNKFYCEGFDEWSLFILNSLKDEIGGMLNAYGNAITVIESSTGIDKYLESFTAEHNMLSVMLEKCSGTWDEMKSFLDEIRFDALPRKSKDADDSAAAYVQGIRNSIKKQISKIKDTFYATENEIKNDNQMLAGVVGELCSIVSDFSDTYSRLKRERNLLDFDDLEHFTLRLALDPEISQEIKNKFDEIMVDEYQDTNGVQEAIFKAISKGDNLFMVGDVKQSIYGFRNAQPSIFTAKSKDYKSNPDAGELILLSHNFRSSKNIIDFVNNIFSKIMSSNIGGLDYTEEHRLIGSRDTEGVVELHIIDKKLEEGDEYTDEELLTDEIAREAMFTAQRIASLVEVEKPLIYDEKEQKSRCLQYRDIAILSRKNKGVSEIFAEQLSAHGIPFYCEDETGDYLISQEISAILSFLKIIDNPLQDIPLLAVMRSPMFLFTEEELAQIRQKSNLSFYHAVCECNSKKCKDFLSLLSYYRDLAGEEKIEFLIRKILSDTGYLSFVSTLPDGEKRAANLRLLCERAGRFEADTHKSLFEFLNYIDAMQEYSYGYSSAKTTGQNDNVVSLMSIHKSKGLEFPVVFLVRCGEKFNKTDLNSTLQYDADLGIGCDFIDISRGIKYPSISKLAVSLKKNFSLLSEEMRVLYVALTRAKDMLYIVGSCPNPEKKAAEWKSSDTLAYTVSRYNTFLDWIGIALGNEADKTARFHTASDILIQSRENVKINDFTEGIPAEKYSEQIARRLEYKYPYAEAANIPTKLPVSKAIGQVQYEINLKKPVFIEKRDKMSAALKGTIIHFILQNIDINKTGNENEIKRQLEEMVEKGMLNSEFKDIISPEALAAFFASDIGKRMRAAEEVHREVRFFVEIPAYEIFEALGDNVKNEIILLQGIVDCYFVEKGELVIIDYKTGRSDRAEYEKQLEFYAKGLSRLLNKKVKETVLYPLI